jgi:hypothetical protein
MPLFLPEKFRWKVKWKIQKFKNEVILEGFKSQKWGEKIVKDCQISTLDFQCVTMSIDSCLKNLYFISGFVICTVKYTHTCALGTGFKLYAVKMIGDIIIMKCCNTANWQNCWEKFIYSATKSPHTNFENNFCLSK